MPRDHVDTTSGWKVQHCKAGQDGRPLLSGAFAFCSYNLSRQTFIANFVSDRKMDPDTSPTWQVPGRQVGPHQEIPLSKPFFVDWEDPDGNVRKIKSFKPTWSANIYHLEDEKVTVDATLGDLKPLVSDDVNALNAVLPMLLNEEVDDIPQTSRHVFLNAPDGLKTIITIEEFTWRNKTVHRRTYHKLDACKHYGDNNVNKYRPQANQVAAHYEALRVAAYPDFEPPSESLLRCIMAVLYSDMQNREKYTTNGDFDQQKLELAAQLEWFQHYDDSLYMLRYQHGALPEDVRTLLDAELQNALELTEKKFHKAILDRQAESICKTVDKDIIVLRDMNNKLLAGQVKDLTQLLFPPNTCKRIQQAAASFSWRVPMPAPDALRHPLHLHHHVINNPHLNFDASQDKHRIVCATDHVGTHHENGRHKLGQLKQQNLSHNLKKSARIMKSPAMTVEYPNFVAGTFGIVAQEANILLRGWDPEYLARGIDMAEHIPESVRVPLTKHDDNPFSYAAFLSQVKTEGHTDSHDDINGLAAITPFGEFSDGMLVLKQMGIKFPYRPGSLTLLRGREMYHHVTGHRGSRIAFVLTNKSDTAIAVNEMKERILALRGKVVELKNAQGNGSILTEDEKELIDIYNKPMAEIKEYLFEQAKAELPKKGEKVKETTRNKAKRSKSIEVVEEAVEDGEESLQKTKRVKRSTKTLTTRTEEY